MAFRDSTLHLTGQQWLENRNYLQRLRSPIFLYRALIALLHSTIWALARRACPTLIRTKSLPVIVRRIRTVILQNTQIHYLDFHCMVLFPTKLKLAVGWLEFKDSDDWGTQFSDPEVTTSLHRWSWLLLGVSEDAEKFTRDRGLALMRSWLRSCILNDAFGNDPYSTAERIVNGSIFLLKKGDEELPEDIQVGVLYMSKQIAISLEYFEGERTGNHALNNGRGLFFAGILTSSKEAIALAVAIFQERMPKLVTPDGFLRESSSHYHFLFTRWILEVIWLAEKYGQEEFATFLKPYAGKLVERCWFFLVRDDGSGNWSIPLIGDISPDYPPNWLLALPWSIPALAVFRPSILPRFKGRRGWATLFGIEEGTNELPPYHSLTFPESFWHRIVRGEFTLFVHAAATDGRLRADHRHLDLGGFVLYRSGSLVFADSGRIDYTNSMLSQYGKGAASHSTIFIDGLPPAADGPSWFQKKYKAVDVKTELRESDASTAFTLQHNGFDRLADSPLVHERRFILTLMSFEIEDRLTGSTSHQIRLRFHLSPGLVMEKSDSSFLTVMPLGAKFMSDDQFQKTIVIAQSSNPVGGVFSPEYGVIDACTTLELDGELTLPAIITNKLNWH